MLRKLLRDRNCRPVLRGILESLLHYLTKDLPNRTTRNRGLEKPVLGIVAERNIQNRDRPIQRTEASTKQTQLQTNGNITEISAKIPEKHCSDQQIKTQPSRCGGDQRRGDLISRRITTFQLLQSKFTRTTPKPPITHQREVGTLSSSKGVASNVNHCQNSESDMYKRGRARREHGVKRGNSVNNIVAKFALAEQKEREENMMKHQVKPRLTGRGGQQLQQGFLSSLMEKFETMATVRTRNDFKCSNEKPSGGVNVESPIKQRVAHHEVEQKQGLPVQRQPVHKQKQQKKMTSKCVRQKLKENPTSDEHQRTQKQNGNFSLEEGQPSDQEVDGSFPINHIKDQVHDNNVNSLSSGEYGKIQTTGEETRYITDKFKYGHLELLGLTCVTEWSLPQPYTIPLQVETPANWHMATILPRSSVWSTCVDSSPKQHFKGPKPEPSESSNLEMLPNLKKCVPLWTVEPSTRVTEEGCTIQSKTEGPSEEEGDHNPMENKALEPPNSPKALTIQGWSPQYVIPRHYRFDSQQGANQTRLAVMPPSHSDTSTADFNSGFMTKGQFQDADMCPLDFEVQTVCTVTENEEAEGKFQQKRKEDGERKQDTLSTVDISGTGVPQSLNLSEITALSPTSKDEMAPGVALPNHVKPTDNNKQRPKYTTINYGDPSVKQTYKPKIIRFTDTFTF